MEKESSLLYGSPDNMAKIKEISRALKSLGFDGVIREEGQAPAESMESAKSQYQVRLTALHLDPAIEATVLNQIALRLS